MWSSQITPNLVFSHSMPPSSRSRYYFLSIPTPINVQLVMSSLCLCGVKEEFVSLKRSKDTSQTGRDGKGILQCKKPQTSPMNGKLTCEDKAVNHIIRMMFCLWNGYENDASEWASLAY